MHPEAPSYPTESGVSKETNLMRPSQSGYLPNDRPAIGRLLLFGFQHVLTMFPATILVALLCGFHTSTVLLAAGLATVVALVLSRNAIQTFIPLFYGSSFSYITSYLGLANAMNYEIKFGVPAPDDLIALMQAGIIATGVINIIVGFFIKAIGKRKIDKVLPPIVTGSVACVIGFGLGKAALEMVFTNGCWAIALATLIITVACSHLLQGRWLLGMVPVVLGAVSGYVLTVLFAPDQISSNVVAAAPMFSLPHLILPSFSGPLIVTAIFSISVMAIATIPESTAHLYQISMYVDKLAERQNRPKVILERHIGVNIICDGVGDVICGICGGPAGTNYGESNSLMAITRNYSGWALMAAGVMCVLLAFIGKFAAVISTIPVFVTGGLAIYLFGVIGMQGIALIQQNRVNLFDPLQLAIGATIMVIGIGGNIGFKGGFLPIVLPGFPNGLPAIATAALVGIAMHLAFGRWKPRESPCGPQQVPSVLLGFPGEDRDRAREE